MKYNIRFLFPVLTMLLLLGCSKEYSLETGGTGAPGSGGGGNSNADYGWKFTGKPTENYHGCIDTAFYESNGPAKALFIAGTDSVGNNFILMLVSPTGSINPGTYSNTQGASMTLMDQNGNTFMAKAPSPFSFQLTKVNDTIAEGTFSGTLPNTTDNTTFIVSNGQFKALIGKENPCAGTTPTPGGGGVDAVFTLTSSGTACSNPFIDGDYFKDVALDASNTVELDVNVTVAGDWSVTTTAVNGMVFSGSGTFTTTGPNSIELTGSGRPTTTGNNVIPLQAGSSTCSFTIPVQAAVVANPGPGDYFPTTANSNWMYEITDLSTGDFDSVKVTSTGQSITIGTQTYSIFTNDLFAGVYRKANGSYYRYGPLDYFGVIDSTKKIETIFLKDNVAVGNTWESAVVTSTNGGSTTKFKRRYTVMAKNVSITVRGIIYNNVITMKEELMVDVGGFGYIPFDEATFNYAKGIGLIQASSDDYDLEVELKRFQTF